MRKSTEVQRSDSVMTTSMDDTLIAILVPLVNIWRRLRQRIFDSYRPELHYMRGPGPKWREKHAHAISVYSA